MALNKTKKVELHYLPDLAALILARLEPEPLARTCL
jgi:hypothetical protein